MHEHIKKHLFFHCIIKVGNTKAVGIYHETYEIKAGNYESVFGNMPLYGLGKAKKHIPITKDIITARKRLDG